MVLISVQVILLACDNLILQISLSIVILMALIIFINAIYHFVLTIQILKGKKIPLALDQSKDLLSLFLVKTSSGKINLIRDTKLLSFTEFENYHWDSNEKEEFIQYLISLSPLERDKILKSMKKNF
jgi:hypothetical protein